MYNNAIRDIISFYIMEQQEFRVVFQKTEELINYLPAEAFNENLVNIDFKNWILETANIYNDYLSFTAVYDNNEFPLEIELISILAVIDLSANNLLIQKVFNTPDEVEVIKHIDEELKKYAIKNKAAIEKSTSCLKLLKVGE